MAGILECLAGPAVELAKCFAEPIKREFGYLLFFQSNIENLKKEIENLDNARKDLQGKIEAAERKGEQILHEVTTWLRRANEIHDEMSGIANEIPNVQSDRFNIISRFLLSRKAKLMTEAMEEHRGSCELDRVSVAALPPSMRPVPSKPSHDFESRKETEEDIMEALREKKFNMMGIYGMGGVGKTTMAKRIMNRVREENLFDEVVMVVVSQEVDMLKIQQKIAEYLDLNLGSETNLSARANELYARLMGKNRVLIILDDVWKKLKLEDIGIPCQSGFQGCTSLLTSRNKDVLGQMDVQKDWGVEILSELEAWGLFKEKAGNWLDDPTNNLLSIANKVALECKGLPIAIVTVGCALKDTKMESDWRNALDQLKNLHAIDMPDVIREVYNPLKLSYEYLESQYAQYLFLLCCLFPEDSDISLKYLTMYSMGLGILGRNTLEEARGRVLVLVQMLKSRSLLMDGYYEHHVKMHDVVRDVATFIAGKKGLIVDRNQSMGSSSYGDCEWISVFPEKRSELSDLMSLKFPGLHLLMMHGSYKDRFEIKEDFRFFEGMKKLNVLSFKHVSLKSIQLLKNLKTLHLNKCDSLETISVVGEELLDLEILCCRFCNNMKELPAEIGRLNRLQSLEFSFCKNLKTVAPSIISKLIELKELKMRNSFDNWESIEANGKETQKNVSLKELESLLKLTHLEIDISDYNLAAEKIHLSSSIEKYCIQINLSKGLFYSKHEKQIALGLSREITLGSWIHEFLRDTEELVLEGNGSNNLVQSQAHKYLKSLEFGSCSTVKKLVDTSSISIDWGTNGHDIFPALEFMTLKDLPNLEEICDGSILEGSPNSFKNMRHLRIFSLPALKHLWKNNPNQNINISLTNLSLIEIWKCGELRNLFSLALIANDALSQLEQLSVINCEMMEAIFSIKENKKGEGDQSHHQSVTFPKLKELELHKLGNLTTFYKGIESIELPLLAKMDIRYCLKLTSLVSSSDDDDDEGHGYDDNSINLFCSQKDVLLQLEELRIANCELMEEIFSIKENKKDGGNQSHHQIITFPKLKILELNKLENLTTFCKGIERIEFPLLAEMKIRSCPKLTSLVSSSSSSSTEGHSYDDNSLPLFCSQKDSLGLFPALELIQLSNLPNLVELCDDSILQGQNINASLINLSSINVWNCDKLHNLFSLALIAKDALLRLEELKIEDCEMMEEIFSIKENKKDGGDQSHHQIITFPKLKKLNLNNLENLTTFCKGIESIEFPLLAEMEIWSCKKLTSLVSSSSSSTEGHGRDDKSLHLFCSQRVAFDSLKDLKIGFCDDNINNIWCRQIPLGFFNILEKLEIDGCDGIRSLFSSSIVGEFFNLKRLSIGSCDEMEKVIGDEEKSCLKSPFPMLEELKLTFLWKLKSFCEWNCDFELPSLRIVKISDCPLMKNFTMESLSTPKIEQTNIDGNKFKDMRDLNGAIQLHVKANEESTSFSAEGEEDEEGEEQEDKGEIKEKEIGEIVEVMMGL